MSFIGTLKVASQSFCIPGVFLPDPGASLLIYTYLH